MLSEQEVREKVERMRRLNDKLTYLQSEINSVIKEYEDLTKEMEKDNVE